MYLKDLEVKDFLTFKDLKMAFENKAYALQGKNLDQDDQETNGVGKSSLFYAIEYLFFGSTSKGGLISDLVRWGAKSSHMNGDIYCSVRRKTLSIERNINNGSKLVLREIDEDGSSGEIDFSTPDDGNKQILKWMLMSKEDIQNYYLISSAKYTSFMTSSNTSKLAMINRLVNLEMLNPISRVMDVKIKSAEKAVTDNKSEKDKAEGALNTNIDNLEAEYKRDLESELADSKKDIESLIESFGRKIYIANKAIKGYDGKVSDLGVALARTGEELLEVTKRSKGIKVKDFSVEIAEYKASIDSRNTYNRQLNNKISANNSDIRTAEEILAQSNKLVVGAIECPSCTHIFNPADIESDIEAEKQRMDSIIEIIDNFKKLNGDVEASIKDNSKYLGELELLHDSKTKEQENQLGVYKEAVKLIDIKSDKVRSLSSSKIDYLERIKTSTRNIEEWDSQIKELEEKANNLKVGTIDAKRIASLELAIEEVNSTLDDLATKDVELLNEVNRLKKWESSLSRFAGELARESLDVMTTQQNIILSEMKSDLRVRWEGFKVNKDNSRSDKITPMVIRDGVEKTFKWYSGGERGRVEYSSILTNQYLINSTHPYGGLDFLFTDEVVEGVDGLGLINIVKALNELDKPILLTTHVVNQTTSPNILTVVKQGGITEIKKDYTW